MIEYKLTGKGNIARIISSRFLSLTNSPYTNIYGRGGNGCTIQSEVLDASARYSLKGQVLKIDGKDATQFAEFLKSELNKKGIRLKPL